MFPDGFEAIWAFQTPIWVLGHLLNPSSLRGGFGDLAISGGIWGEKRPKKKFQNVFGGTWEGY